MQKKAKLVRNVVKPKRSSLVVAVNARNAKRVKKVPNAVPLVKKKNARKAKLVKNAERIINIRESALRNVPPLRKRKKPPKRKRRNVVPNVPIVVKKAKR